MLEMAGFCADIGPDCQSMANMRANIVRSLKIVSNINLAMSAYVFTKIFPIEQIVWSTFFAQLEALQEDHNKFVGSELDFFVKSWHCVQCSQRTHAIVRPFGSSLTCRMLLRTLFTNFSVITIVVQLRD